MEGVEIQRRMLGVEESVWFVRHEANALLQRRFLSHWLNQCFTVCTRLIHQARHGIGVEGDAGTAFEDVEDLVRGRDFFIEPAVLEVSVKNHGHAVVELGHKAVRVFGDDREGVDFLTIRVYPDVVEASKGKEFVARRVDVVGRFATDVCFPLCYMDMSSQYA
jgi:hypothetical protein